MSHGFYPEDFDEISLRKTEVPENKFGLGVFYGTLGVIGFSLMVIAAK